MKNPVMGENPQALAIKKQPDPLGARPKGRERVTGKANRQKTRRNISHTCILTQAKEPRKSHFKQALGLRELLPD